MKIGILTFHRAHNYGAVLQCFALQRFLQGQGHQVRVIDYNKKALWRYYGWFKSEDVRYAFSDFRKLLKRSGKLFFFFFCSAPRFYKFRWFQNHRLKLCSTSEIIQEPFDLILIGSDQVWNTTITCGFDAFYWGQFEKPSKTKVASYAASLKKLWDEKDWPTVLEYLSAFCAISVRENNVAEFLLGLNPDLNPRVVPDPVFLLSAKEWSKFALNHRIDEPYVFFYQAMDSDSAFRVAERVASEKGMRLVVLSANVNGRNSRESRSSSPIEFVGWIKNAEIVVTSSFHATAFSIIFHKDFLCVDLNKGEDSRLKCLLSLFGLESRFIRSEDEYHALSFNDYDCQDELASLQNTAIRYFASIV